ncbi:hypothetical protein KIH31_13030 [Paenarthrobacter sp. DKR-5]|uniref:hypothetical protein n=1 Tax=Paenarthrobacter sp. DKR-5 TaxID=2835535 RepID=UPI001BDBF75A|nr:hypothetical protein [Paenarthrobacter sp. DKR-5]MBT1003528.1 hypothetical protein [Paenarthrobacter sp. DKR-5]
MINPYFALFVVPWGLFLFVCGILLYRKIWLGLLALNSVAPGQPGLAATYIGAWLATLPFGNWWLSWHIPVLPALLSFANLACLVIGIVGCFWMPRFMQPRWLRETNDAIKRGEDLYTLKYGRGASRPAAGQTNQPTQAPDGGRDTAP